MEKILVTHLLTRRVLGGLIIGIVTASYVAIPLTAFALGDTANDLCKIACRDLSTSAGIQRCSSQVCTDSSSTSGKCSTVTGMCHATTAGGSSLAGIGSLLTGIAALITAMKGTPAAATAAAAPVTSPYGYGCPNGTYTVTAPSTDPCAVYQPASTAVSSSLTTTTSSSAGTDLASALGISAAGSALSDALGGIVPLDGTNGSVTTGGVNSLPTASSTSQTPIQPQGNGIHGDIKIDLNGATVFASNQDQATNQTVAAFYGVNTTSDNPGAVAAQICINRPWASDFLASVAPAAFFDGLCKLHGFQVGAPVVTPAKATPVPEPKPPTPVATTTAATTPVGYTGPNVPPQVQIWTVPTSVSLGTRTSVFWSSQGVYNCTVTSPDGSFNQNTTSGGASTVPLSADTTFTISCFKPDNTPITALTTVKMAR